MDRQTLFQTLLDLVEEETGDRFEDTDEGTDLRSGFRLDSVDLVSLILKTEVRLGIKITSTDLHGVTTVGQLLDLLHRKLSGSADPSSADQQAA